MTLEKTIWSVGGGKGGIGKSVVTANIGCALAMAGKKVVLVDADLGGANLHTYFGIKFPEKGLEDYIKGRIGSLDGDVVAHFCRGTSHHYRRRRVSRYSKSRSTRASSA